MLDRYSIGASATQLAERFQVEVTPAYKPRFNAAPSQLLPVITSGSQGISFFYWGTSPQWSKNKTISEKIVNLRADALREKPVFMKKLARFRCVVPADGFYLWKRVGKKSNIPYRFFLKSKELFAMAGLWEEYEDEKGEDYHTFTIITVPSNRLIQPAQERMPAILEKKFEADWLNPESQQDELLKLLTSFPASLMDSYPISPRISNVQVDDASLILPTPPADQHGNLTLFD